MTLQASDARQVIFESLTMQNWSALQPERNGAVYIDSPNSLVTFSTVTIKDSVAGFRGGGTYIHGDGTLNVINSTNRKRSVDPGDGVLQCRWW